MLQNGKLFIELVMATNARAQSYGSEEVDYESNGSHTHELWYFDENYNWCLESSTTTAGQGSQGADQEDGQVDWNSDEPGSNPNDEDDDWQYPDWQDILEWMDYWDQMANTHDINNSEWGPTNDSNMLYYIRVDNLPEKHYDGSRFKFATRNNPKVKFSLGMENGIVAPEGLQWKINGSIFTEGNNKESIWLSPKNKGDYRIEVWDKEIPKKLISFKVQVYGGLTVIFERKSGYTGEYGLDDEGCQYASLENDYRKMTVDDKQYDAPWLSLLHATNAIVAIKPLIPSGMNINDNSAWVEFRTSASGKVKVNGGATLHKNLVELIATPTINIYATELDSVQGNRAMDSIIVVGDTVGKLMVSCQKPIKKRLLLVYVNTGQGYRPDITKPQILNINYWDPDAITPKQMQFVRE